MQGLMQDVQLTVDMILRPAQHRELAASRDHRDRGRPPTAVGKCDKRRLREEHAARLATVLDVARTPTPIEQGATR
jgi:hypothetical protein